MRTETEINALLRRGERETLECKSAAKGLPKSLWQTYSAFANTGGGTIVLGVDENHGEKDPQKRFTVAGLPNPDKIISELWSGLNNRQKVSLSILVDDNVEQELYRGRAIVIITVPAAECGQRPVYINGNILSGTFKRNYEGDYHCGEDVIKAMLRDAKEGGNDGALVENFTLDDLDDATIRSYRNEFQGLNPGHIWNGYDDREFLRNLEAWAVHRPTGREWLTQAGLLVFGKGLSIREYFDNISMDYRDLTGLLPGRRWSDRLTYDGTWENNLYGFLRLVLPKLTIGLKRPFHMEGVTRVDDTPVHKALREALVNMIIHCDFMVSGTLEVLRKEEGFFFNNPGTLKLPLAAIYAGGSSTCRNPKIQKMLRLIGLCEAAGSGFPIILDAWRKESWPEPNLYENAELNRVELRLWLLARDQDEVRDQDGDQDRDQDDVLKNEDILSYCHQPRALAEIMNYFNRKSRTKFKRVYLDPLVATRQIAMTIPEKPTSKNQRYVTVSHDEH